ncbi:MAG: histidine--tRNA ligase [Bacteroidales bacterium]|nr:histidine--tRNA ligase [Bacteroidales bacterium]
MQQKPSVPKGTRDFLPAETAKRNYIFQTIKDVFQLYGYVPIETPAMENLSTLLGKYGEEGDKLLFKILNSGDFLEKTGDAILQSKDSNKLSLQFCEKGLRYDLTVPFARFIVQHRNDITFPFKRYQIQPVWRADRPQKGRYREFYQCDVDVIGSDSLMNEVELVQIIDVVFRKLGIDVTIKLNNRKLLAGLSETIGETDKLVDITVAIDKLDKIGIEKVNEELRLKGISEGSIEKLQDFIRMKGNNLDKLQFLRKFFAKSEKGIEGISELETLFGYLKGLSLKTEVFLDLSLARGLNYYTGSIIEVKADNYEIGSICGGGRYDNLTGIFGLENVSGVGISFGADRIYDVLYNLEKFPLELSSASKLMFVNFGPNEEKYILGLAAKLRNENISTEIYPDAAKIKKQLTYANNKGIEYVMMIGEEEMQKNLVTLKDMVSGQQQQMTLDEAIKILQK